MLPVFVLLNLADTNNSNKVYIMLFFVMVYEAGIPDSYISG